MRFGKHGKLSHCYIRPFEILEKVDVVAYKLALPPNLSMIHPVFHVSILHKYVSDTFHILALQAVQLNETLSYEEKPIVIVDQQVKKLQSKNVNLVRVIWKNHFGEETIWEVEEAM